MSPTQVDHFLQRLNDAWLTQDYVELRGLYHPDVVLLPPDAGDPILGNAAVIDSYRDFHAACRVERFAITSQTSWEFAATTMVHMRFDIDYQLGAATPLQSEQGLEVYTLATAADSALPQIVWRAQFAL